MPYGVLLFLCFLGHGLLLVNDGIYWDDVWVQPYLDARNWSGLYAFFAERGLPFFAFFHWIRMGFRDSVLAAKLLSFVSILTASFCAYRLARRLPGFTRGECLVVAALAALYPAFQVSVAAIHMPYLLCYALFMGGAVLTMSSSAGCGALSWARRGTALILLFISFNLNSLLVFYAGCLVLWLVSDIRQAGAWKERACRLWRFVRTKADFIFLPMAYWLIKEMLFPRESAYNRFALSYENVWGLFRAHVQSSILGVAARVLREFYGSPAIWSLFAFLAGLAVWRLLRRRPAAVEGGGFRTGLVGLLVGLLLYVCAVYAYTTVGLYPDTARGWETRHSILVGLPVAIMIVSLGRWLKARMGRWGVGLASVALAVLLAAFTKIQLDNYISWQARWIKDRAMVHVLSQHREWSSLPAYWIEDLYPLGGDPYYRYFEWSFLFRRAWGMEGRVGYDRAFYALERGNLPPNQPRPESTLCVARRTSAGPAKLTLDYLWTRWIRPERMDGFLEQVVSISVRPQASRPD